MRQGLATSFFFIGYFSESKKKSTIFYISSCFIHYLFFIAITILLINFTIKKLFTRNDFNLSLFFKSFIIFLIPVIILFLFNLDFLSSNISRLNNYLNYLGKFNFGNIHIFFIIILILLLNKNNINNKTFFSINCIIFFLISSIFFSPMSRFIIALSPLILIEASRINKNRNLVIFLYSLYAFYILLNLLFKKEFGSIAFN